MAIGKTMIPQTMGGYGGIVPGGRFDHGSWSASDPAPVKQYAIQGQMVSIKQAIDVNYLAKKDSFTNDAFKEQLTKALIDELIDRKLIEFTYIDDPTTQRRIYHARCFLVPDDNVRMLRMLADGTWI